MAFALKIILVIISFILLVLLYLQSGKVKNVGSSIIGTKDVELFENIKHRGNDRILHIITVVLVILFVAISFTLLFI
ncbi:/ / preprotein translocase subunit SecG / 34108:34338 Forward [Candidatus Hepatoplasma crinochetorum]|uniref:Protein-export membrane protein SecG n=1 Tax=Candidatus Hepatoplasma crinochetorum TaxID=295596 RepID=A0A0G7ZLX1_9MOLU|nr:/ / preprotein translocase subunit SecG / 34108:34338 Forward [Candidatus Hepatoplasma crinochetorum]